MLVALAGNAAPSIVVSNATVALLLRLLVSVFLLPVSRTKAGLPCLKSEWWSSKAECLRSISVAAPLQASWVRSLGSAESCLKETSRLAARCPAHAAVVAPTF